MPAFVRPHLFARICSLTDKILLCALLCLTALPALAAPHVPVATLDNPNFTSKERADLAALPAAKPAT